MELAAKFNLAMGLRAKFNLVILAAFAVGFLMAAVALNRVFIDNAREQVLGNARIMMTAANAIRNYTVQELVPLLPAEHDGKFVPETVPAYAAQKNFKEVQAAFTGYTYREPALNPTNPSDRAQDWEADIIGLFRNEPKRQELVVVRDTPLGPSLNLARPMPARTPAPTCHSTSGTGSADAQRRPATGSAANQRDDWRADHAPMAVPLAGHHAYVTLLIILMSVFAIVLVILNLLLHYLIIAPVKRVSAMAEAVSLGEEDVETYIKPGKDEVAMLSVAFDRMRESLRQAMAMIK
jgi:protein-histidine pros-kinase